MPRALRIVVVSLCVIALLLTALVPLAGGGSDSPVALAQGSTYNTLRIYGRANEGAGNPSVTDRVLGTAAEDPAYQYPAAIFHPQLMEAPRKDSLTWNPLFMSELETFDENYAHGLYNEISAGPQNPNATEKVIFRTWYEPWHWDKDLNANGVLDIDASTQLPYTESIRDEWYPAIMQEFTYMLLENARLADNPLPMAGRAGDTAFVFPVGMRAGDLFAANGAVDTSSANARYGYGLTSLDGDFDGIPDIVNVASEQSLAAQIGVDLEFNGLAGMQSINPDGLPLSGDEMVVLHLDSKSLAVGDSVQFLDHLVIVSAVLDDSAQLEVWYTGDMTPEYLGRKTIAVGQALRSARNVVDTNAADFTKGPFFAFVESMDQAEDKARVIVGRALGAPYSAMEDGANHEDVRPGDPWFLKRVYVDGHEYNVVAIMSPAAEEFQFITIRTPIPKTGEYDDPQIGHLIEQHSVRLQPYPAAELLSVMPPFNYEHYIVTDIQKASAFLCDADEVPYSGALVGPVPPIISENVSVPYRPYRKSGTTVPSYSNRREMELFYVDESTNWQFLGEHKELYGQYPAATPQPEFWYSEQFHTMPWQYTEFVLPDMSGQTDLYLLTSSFIAEQSEYLLWQDGLETEANYSWNLEYDDELECWTRSDDLVSNMINGWQPRIMFWFDPAQGGKKYKDDDGIRIYGRAGEGAGDPLAVDPMNEGFPVEVAPYTDPWAPFNPDLAQAPAKDSLTFNPAYMDKYYHGYEPLAELYRKLSVNGRDAREKVFFRMWYEPEYLDKQLIAETNGLGGIGAQAVDAYTFPAVMQEFTYMYLDTSDRPTAALAGNGSFAFPMGTAANQLPAPVNGALPTGASFGYGLTTFDGDFDGTQDTVHIHSEESLLNLTGTFCDFNGDGVTNTLDMDAVPLNGNEMVVFALEEKLLSEGESVQFLDHMVTLSNVSAGGAELQFWYTGGGLHQVGNQYSLHPDKIGSPLTVPVDRVAIADHTRRKVSPVTGNAGAVDGAWFVFVDAVNNTNETASVIVGRALGHTHSAIDNGAASHDLTPGDPWYLKRFFVDGHEYNVVAVHIEPVPSQGGAMGFKYITIRTPVPKVNFVNQQDSQKLEGYFLGPVLGVDTSVISVMPPFNYEHTQVEDIVALGETAVPSGGSGSQFVFGNSSFQDDDCRGNLLKNVPPYQIRIVDEDREPQFLGELKQIFAWDLGVDGASWLTEQFHVVPDQYTEFKLPAGRKYLLTSDWRSAESRVSYYGCPGYTQDALASFSQGSLPGVNTTVSLDGYSQEFFGAAPDNELRVKFLYDPQDNKDVYVSTWQGGTGPTPTPTATATPTSTPIPGTTGTISGQVTLQGRSSHGGVVVAAGGFSTSTDASGNFSLAGLPGGTYTVRASRPGYLYAERVGAVVTSGGVTQIGSATLLGGDANADCLVDLFDLVIVAWNYGTVPPADIRADINGNGSVDIFDLVMVGANLDKACPGQWTLQGGGGSRSAVPAVVRVEPAAQSGEVDDELTVDVILEDVNDLYGADVQLTFDAAILEVVDADPETDGVQVARGTFLDPADGTVTQDVADNELGTIDYAIALKQPASPVDGSGTLFSVTFKCKAEGLSPIEIESADLSDVAANSLELSKVGGTIRVGSEYLIHLPIVIKLGQ